MTLVEQCYKIVPQIAQKTRADNNCSEENQTTRQQRAHLIAFRGASGRLGENTKITIKSPVLGEKLGEREIRKEYQGNSTGKNTQNQNNDN